MFIIDLILICVRCFDTLFVDGESVSPLVNLDPVRVHNAKSTIVIEENQSVFSPEDQKHIQTFALLNARLQRVMLDKLNPAKPIELIVHLINKMDLSLDQYIVLKAYHQHKGGYITQQEYDQACQHAKDYLESKENLDRCTIEVEQRHKQMFEAYDEHGQYSSMYHHAKFAFDSIRTRFEDLQNEINWCVSHYPRW